MATFHKNLEKATSQLLLEPDWDSVLQIVDCIRQGDVQVKVALLAIKKKIGHENPHVAVFALQVLEACVKNCGSTFHTELATKEFMEFLKDQVKSRPDPVKEKILELIQTWSHAFRNEPHYKAVEDTFHLLKMEGHKFPALKEADAMFDAEKAPSWKDSETCTRCRVQFNVIQRKHHCRNCGEVFCGKCSSKTSIIPKLGFEREVRVCDSCFEKINKKQKGKKAKRPGQKKDDELPAEYLASPLSKQSQAHAQVPPSKTDQEQQEEEELMLAIALSKSEHETKEKERERLRSNYGVYGGGKTANERPTSPAKATVIQAPLDTSDMDPELARYLNRHYWQQKSETQAVQLQTATTVPSAPAANNEARVSTGQINEAPQVVSSHLYQNGDTDDGQEQFLSALQGSLEIFVNRMRSNSQRGRPIANDSAVQSLFAVISEMHPQLMTHIQEREDERAYYEGLQDKLTQLRDAREALDSLREEYKEKRRREAEELERLRQIQMMQKLEVMRQKKHEYLEMQRQLALQRLQEQEREMAARLEQQKHLTHIRQMQTFGYPQSYTQPMMSQAGMVQNGAMGPHSYTQGGGSNEGSPVHRVTGAPDGFNNMQQGLGPQSLPPHITQAQAGMYHMGGQYVNPGPGSLPPGGYQTDGQVMMGPQSYIQGDQGPVSLPPNSMVGHMSAAGMGGYGGMASQVTAGGVHHSNPTMLGVDGQAGYGAGPAPSQDFQSFNMQGLATALPSHQNPGMYSNPPQSQQQYIPQGQQQYQQQQPYIVSYQQGGQPPSVNKEKPLISFDD
ncbi:hepatocyte growth factor-regulated tyrosine kinase substrate-like isoform X3 [Physella acuta]|uniref:hepatocyte growth factor-regulated tyrosine kinase substrate-like isoform X3 n=2 Tax=Physella acuta TaxID=109671 RepID=UPI0027DCA6AA|nr:hepatocyte growth factor-regulated tyrosine kinase substrate-like isoform X3 [Physella acuta]